MREVLPKQKRRGTTEISLTCEGGQNAFTLRATFGEVADDVGFHFLIEQFTGDFWSVLGGADVPDLASVLRSKNKDGSDRDGLVWNFYEQLYVDAKQWATSREYQVSGKTYKQLAICAGVRVTVDTYTAPEKGQRLPADLEYSIDIGTEDKPRPEVFDVKFGRN